MELLFLGTSSGTPTKTRNVTALALIEDQGSGWCLIDCGEGTQHQLLQTSLSVRDLQAIFITHVHGDHCYGLPGLLASAGMGGRNASLKIVAPEGIEEWFRSTQVHTQLHLPFEIEFVRAEPLRGLQVGQWFVDAIELSHRVPSFAYSFTEAHVEPALDTEKLLRDGVPQGPLWGRLKKGQDVEHQGRLLRHADYLTHPYAPRKIIVGGDNDRPALLTEASKGCQVLVHEATYTADVAAKVGPGVGHSYAELVAAFAQSVGLPHLVLTHFSARYQSNVEQGPSMEDIRLEAASVYHGKLALAEDFARYRLNRAGELSSIAIAD
ncbi:MAG TPA: MBL fold metallo-hydrolase [Ideonella sp.]|uniref:ribonuclease Z n=1 Tax=Ideonella sp. TaxID=1929293 RepID=UPI002E3750E1|nr:MBL fold metallo-hydrolase [Ideonella sp.]HEX5685788.1 MBL fold metallo-hydrolase [Ideonella sp.]